MNVLDGWDAVVGRLRSVFRQKIGQYGVKRYDPGLDPEFKYWMAYCDVYRKFLRLELMTKLAIRGDQESRKKLISDYMDLANYAIAAVQILEGDDNAVVN